MSSDKPAMMLHCLNVIQKTSAVDDFQGLAADKCEGSTKADEGSQYLLQGI
jgi:hypothetical protein